MSDYEYIVELTNREQSLRRYICELERLISELVAERDAAFKMSGCECGPEDACKNLAEKDRLIAELEANIPRWIPVSERLPDMTIARRFVGKQQIFKSENVLVFENGKVKIERIELIEDWSQILNKAAHWMPLPEAPEVSDD